MSRTPSSSPSGPQTSATVVHQRSLSEQSSASPSVNVSVNASYNGSLLGRRPAAAVTTVQKRRFRTQSSTLDSGTRRSTNQCSATRGGNTGGEAHAVVRHTRPTHDVNAESAETVTKKSSGSGEVSGGVVLPSINGAAAAVPSSSQSNTVRVKKAQDGAAKTTTPALEAQLEPAKEGEAPRDLSSSLPLNSTTMTSGQHVVMKERPNSLNRTAPPTTVSVSDLTAAPTAVFTEDSGRVGKPSPKPAAAAAAGSASPPSTAKKKTREASAATPKADETPTTTPSSSSDAKPVTTSPPREFLTALPRKEAAAEAPATSTTPLAPLRGSTRVGAGNSEEAAAKASRGDGTKSRGTSATAVDSVTPPPPPPTRRDSALPAGTKRSVQNSPNVENAAAPVTLPRVGSQTSANSLQRASNATVKSSADSAVVVVDTARGSTPVSQPLKASGTPPTNRLQPHPPSAAQREPAEPPSSSAAPAPPLQSIQTVSPNPEKEHKTQQPSRHASQLDGATTTTASKSSAKSNYGVMLPAIVNLFSTPVSLRNFGATCYLNSVVQCLLFTPGLLRALDKDRQRIIREWEQKRGGKFDEAHRRSCAERNAPATSALLDLGTAKPPQETPTPQLLLSLKAACGECNEEFAGNGQNDAHEFLITLLGVIDKEVSRTKPEAYETMKDVEDEGKRDAYARWAERLRRENDSTIYDFFGGVTGSTVQCATCALISYRFEALLDISLPMAYNSGPRAAARAAGSNGSSTVSSKNGKARPDEVVAVDLLLHDMFFSDRGEFLSGPMQVTCDRCKKLRDKTIWSTIEQWPPILVLHLKRFNNAGVKNESAVIFPYTFCPFGRVKYQLYGVCLHRGTASFGHYTSYVYSEGEAALSEMPMRLSAAAARDAEGQRKAKPGDGQANAESLRSAPSNSFARSTDDAGSGPGGEECDLPYGLNMSNTKAHSGGSGSSANGHAKKAGKWYLCNDEHITTVEASEVVSKTKEAYILFYRRVA